MIIVMMTCAVFVASVSWAALLLGGVWGNLTVDVCRLSLWIGALSALISLRSAAPQTNSKRPSSLDILLFFLFLSICFRVLFWIYFDKEGVWTTPELIHTRLAVFIAQVRNLAEGQMFWPQNPVHASQRYLDFGFPLFFAVFQKLAVPFSSLLPVVAVASAVVLAGALWLWAGGLGIAAFLTLGGTYGLYLMGISFWEGVRGFGSSETVFFSALPVMVFLSHPEFFFVFPAGILLAVSLRKRLDESQAILPHWVEVLIWMTLALYHLQSFMLLSLFFLVWAFGRSRALAYVVIRTFVKTLFFLSPLLLFMTDFGKNADVWGTLHLKSAFKDGGGTAYFLRSAGWFLPWLLACLWTSLKGPDRRNALCLAFPPAAGFVFFLFFDTTSRVGSSLPLAAWCYIFLFFTIRENIIRPRRFIFKVVLLVLLIVPGLMIYKSSFRGYFSAQSALGTREDRALCEALRDFPKEDRFAASLQLEHPLPACGVSVVSIYNDVAFYEGAAERTVCLNLRRLLSGDKDWRQIAESLGVRYLFWGALEERDFGSHSTRPWEEVAPKALSGPWGTLYDFGKPGPLSSRLSGDQGLEARFYNNKTFQGEPVMIRRAGPIDFHWNDSSREILKTPLGIIFEGEVQIPSSEEITYFLVSDDGSRLFLDDELVIDNGGNHALRIKPGKKALSEGWHRIRVEYDNEWGVGTVRLWWKLPSGEEELISEKSLRHTVNEAGKSTVLN